MNNTTNQLSKFRGKNMIEITDDRNIVNDASTEI